MRIGHRGASGLAPEHTRRAFQLALDLGVDMIELDVHLSRDGELVVIHDGELERTTTGRGLVRDNDLAELKALDAGAWFAPEFSGERLLSLDEVVDLVGARAALNVELKAPPEDWAPLVARLDVLLRGRGLLDSVIISCFAPAALLAVRERIPAARVGLLWQTSDFSEAWNWAGRLRAASLHPHWSLLSADVLAAAHAREMKVLVWTVNDVETMRMLVAAGVDGIMSDYPDRFGQVATIA